MIANTESFAACSVMFVDPSRGSLPFVVEATAGTSTVPRGEVLAWIGAEKLWLEQKLHVHGAILLRGFQSLRTAADFEDVVRLLSHELLDYTGGHTPRSAVAGKVVTSTDAPCHLTIGQHQEMSYLEPTPEIPDPTPDKVAFFCQVAPGGGGQTPLCDMRIVHRRLPAELVARFEARGLRLTRRLPEIKEAGYEATWPTVLGTTDRDAARAFAERRGWRLEWTDDGGACVYQRPSPAVTTHRITGERVWFNQAHLLHKHYAPWTTDFLGPSPEQRLEAERQRPRLSRRFFFHTTHADGSEIAVDDLECIRRVIAETMVMFDWRVGDLLICDNKLVAHGRQPYTPPRTVLAALAADTARSR